MDPGGVYLFSLSNPRIGGPEEDFVVAVLSDEGAFASETQAFAIVS